MKAVRIIMILGLVLYMNGTCMAQDDGSDTSGGNDGGGEVAESGAADHDSAEIESVESEETRDAADHNEDGAEGSAERTLSTTTTTSTTHVSGSRVYVRDDATGAFVGGAVGAGVGAVVGSAAAGASKGAVNRTGSSKHTEKGKPGAEAGGKEQISGKKVSKKIGPQDDVAVGKEVKQ